MTTLPTDNTYLLLDASSATVFVGLLRGGVWLELLTSTEQALESIFQLSDKVLKKHNLSLEKIDGFIYCEGPGSTLGLRVVAMALETWKALDGITNKALYSYNALHYLAKMEAHQQGHVITPLKKGYWTAGSFSEEVINYSEISDEHLNQLEGPILYLEQRKCWRKVDEYPKAHYAIERITEVVQEAGFIKEMEHPSLFQTQKPEYQKWEPGRHR